MKKLSCTVVLAVLCFSFSFSCKAQFATVPIGNTGMVVTVDTGNARLQNINNNPNAVNLTTGVADAKLTPVPIGFSFPYQGKSFTESWMSENGVVTFKDPGNYTFCCNGLPLKSLNNSMFDYTIFPLWSNWSTEKGGSLYTLQNGNERTYGWYNVNESGSNNKASFELSLRENGTFKTVLSNAVVSLHQASSGFTGDVLKGEKYQVHHSNIGTVGEKNLTWEYDKIPNISISVFEDAVKVKSAPTPLLEIPVPQLLANSKGLNFSGFDILRMSTEKNSKKEEKESKEELKKDDNGSGDNTLIDGKAQMDKLNVLSFNNPLVLQMYSKPLADAPFYKDRGVYVGQRVVDNERASKALQSEGLHKSLVEQQWDLK